MQQFHFYIRGLQSIAASLVASCLFWASVLSIDSCHAMFCGLCLAATQHWFLPCCVLWFAFCKTQQALLNPRTPTLIDNRHAYTGNVHSEKPGDSENTFLHCGDVLPLWSQQQCARTGRRDDLWSWLYVLVEMLDGGLCWRIGKDKADRRAEDASRHLNSKHLDAEKQKKKEIALKRKQAALTDPDLLTANVVLPGAKQVLMPFQSVLSHKVCNE